MKYTYRINMMLLMVGAAALTGCAHTPTVEVVTKTKIEYIKPSDNLMKDCPVTKPITKEEYLKLDPPYREVRLSEQIIDLYSDMKKCNLDKKAMRDYVHGVTQKEQK